MEIKNKIFRSFKSELANEHGRVGYLILWLMGAPIGLLFVLWVLLGNNLFGAG